MVSLSSYTLARGSRLFFPGLIISAFFGLFSVYAFLGVTTALKGSYSLIGLIIGAVLYYRILSDETGTEITSRHHQSAQKCLFIVISLSFVYTFITGQRGAVLLVGIPVGYGLVALQYASGQDPQLLVPQIAAVFTLSPVTKYLTTTFYWGRSDLFLRAAEIDGLLRDGSVSGIPGRYEFFPNLHLISAEVTMLTGIPSHDGIVIAGIAAYAGTVFAMYGIARQITNNEKLSIGVCLAYTGLVPVHYYTTYFFPQALATAYFVYLFLSVSQGANRNLVRFNIVTLLFICAFVFSHHLSLLIIVPIVGIMVIVGNFRDEDIFNWRKFGLQFLILTTASLIHWSYYGKAWWFYVQLVDGTRILIAAASGVLSTSGSSGGTYAFGTTVPTESVWSVVIYPPYIHLVAMVALFSVGAVVALARYDTYRRTVPVLVAGVVGSVLLFDTPIAFPGLNRIRLPWALPFAFVLGTGIFASLKQTRTQRGLRIGLVLVVVLSATAPMAAADDLGKFSVHPQTQHAYSESEYRQMDASADFYTAYGDNITMLWASARTYRRFNINSATRAGINASGITTEQGLFLYRHEWEDHLVRNILRREGNRTSSVYVSQQFINRTVGAEDKVYTSGQVEMSHHTRREVLGARPVDTNETDTNNIGIKNPQIR